MTNYDDAANWLEQQVIEFDWYGSRDGLSKENIDTILHGNGWEVESDLIEMNLEYEWESEKYLIDQAIDDFDLTKVEAERLREEPPAIGVDVNLRELVRCTKAYIGVDLGIEHDTHYQEYGDVESELEDLGLNPHDVDEEWPDIQGREPVITVDSLHELWVNDFYGGAYVALLDGVDVLEAALKGELDQYTVLKAGAPITIYDFWNGSGSMIVNTERDIEIDPKEIYHDGAMRYGVQSCYGLIDSEWRGELARAEEGEKVAA